MSPEIVGVGACVMDTLVTLARYPAEDTKQQALSVRRAGGGPTATGLVGASKLGCSAGFIGHLSEDSTGSFLTESFARYGVDTSGIRCFSEARSFTSTIWLSQESASRTCVFDRGTLPPLRLTEAQKEMIRSARILMIDGNETEAAIEACTLAREHQTAVLYDCGGLYRQVDRLLALTDYMIPSEEFALGHTGCASPEGAAHQLWTLYHPRFIVITQGKRGGLFFDGTAIRSYPAFPVNAVDTNGSGDIFHGAFAAALCKGLTPWQCCLYASAAAAVKCTAVGAWESAPDHPTVMRFLKEQGYEF